MKAGIRIIGISSAPLIAKRVLIVGLVYRSGIIEGLISTFVTKDYDDATERIENMIKTSRFKSQIRIIALNGIAIAGLNIVDIFRLRRSIGVSTIILTRSSPHPRELIAALKGSSIAKADLTKRIRIIERAEKEPRSKIKGLYLSSDLEKNDQKKFAEDAFNSLRISHMIASGVSTGESKGRI